MNSKIKWLSVFLFMLTIVIGYPAVAKGATLDEIQSFKITVDVNQDGTLNMNYKIKWKVLDSDSEGPLTWVKIGIPNQHVDKIKGKTDNIKDIRYYEESGQYIRIDFDRSYYAGEVVQFEFSFHQGYMYTIDEESKRVTYQFTPGWFDEIEVKKLTINWNAAKVKETSTDNKDGDYYIWNTSLKKGDRYPITINYDINAYSFDPDQQWEDNSEDYGFIAVIVIIVGIIVITLCIGAGGNSNYRGGFGPRSGSTTFISSNHRTGCVRSACACACACACAGGGRAGCSLKDFYGTNLQTKRLKRIIKKKY